MCICIYICNCVCICIIHYFTLCKHSGKSFPISSVSCAASSIQCGNNMLCMHIAHCIQCTMFVQTPSHNLLSSVQASYAVSTKFGGSRLDLSYSLSMGICVLSWLCLCMCFCVCICICVFVFVFVSVCVLYLYLNVYCIAASSLQWRGSWLELILSSRVSLYV